MAEVSLYEDSREYYPYSYSKDSVVSGTMLEAASKLRQIIAPFRFKLAAREISRELHLENDNNILELGTGLGLLGESLKEEIDRCVKYFGVELMFRSARESGDKGIIEAQSDVINLPYKNESFDAVVSTDVLEHIPHASQAVQEVFRVLKPNGKAFFVIADPSEGRFNQVKDHINRTGGKNDIKYWEKLFKASGFDVQVSESDKYRKRDWRKIFNLPFLVKLKDRSGFACAFNPIHRPGVYILRKI